MLKEQKGFTLVELLVVVAIIGLLSTLAAVSLGSARSKARDAKRLSDIKQLSTALELYYSDNNGYPAVAAAGINLGEGTNKSLSSVGFAATPTAPTYMGNVPADPAPQASGGPLHYIYNSKATDGVTNCTAAPCPNYTIQVGLEGTTGGIVVPPTTHNATPSGLN